MMRTPLPRTGTLSALAAAALLALSGCNSLSSALEGDKIDYKSAKSASGLEVPPDLTQLSRGTRYNVPGASVTASAQASATPQQADAGAVAATSLSDVRIERAGNQRWLVVGRPADKLWGPVRDFWQENGFLLALDQSELGIMETDWAENRAKIPQDIIRQTIGKVFDSLYSTSERDKFRTRLERTASGATEIYVSHRGMQEVFTNAQRDQTVWQPRPADPELEAEFLRRLMVKLGVPQEQAKAVAAENVTPAQVQITALGGVPTLQVADNFDRTWRRVGLALDRTGFTVEDRDRSNGMYFVRYVDPKMDKKEPGLLTRLFGNSNPTVNATRYRIAVRGPAASGNQTYVQVFNDVGSADASANAQRILQVIADDLK